MNVLGEGFNSKIIDQIEQRQKIYGSGYKTGTSRSPEEITYLNANTSWCKLVSATDIKNADVLNIPSIKNLGLTGAQLAKEFILFNGTSYYDGSTKMRGGITDTNSWSGERKAYGIGTNEFGIRPMPGIQSVDVTHENRGSLRSATVKLKAWNRFQFEIIDVLYLRLGFSVLLEWGHSMYFNNSGGFNSEDDFSLANDFLNGKGNYNTFLKKISDQRLNSLGNYDAMFAKVKNFSWSFQKDGSYDITLDLMSSGDIIESLKINAIVEDPLTTDIIKDIENTAKERPEASDDLIPFYAKKNTIGYFLYYLWYALNKSSYAKNTDVDIADDCLYFSFSDLPGGDQDLTGLGASPGYGSNATAVKFNKNDFEPGYVDAINWEFDAYDSDGGDEQYFVRLGAFMAFLQNYLVPRCTGGEDNTGGQGQPLLQFDYKTEDNIFALHRWQVSEDPRIAIVGRTINFPESGKDINDPASWDTIVFYKYNTPIENTTLGEINGIKYGNVMNIYLNFRFIIQKIDELKDDKNKLSLFDLLKGICEGMNTALGGLNNFAPIIEEETNTVKIIDQNPLPNKEEILKKFNLPEQLAMFYMYGYSGDKAGFIKDFSFATEITPEFATMVTVGAAANGSVVGENSTALSKLNIGLKDRYKEEVVDKIELQNRKKEDPAKLKDEYEAMKERYANTIEGYWAFLDDMEDTDLDINSDDIDAYKGTLKNLIDFEFQLKQKKETAEAIINSKPPESVNAPGTGFIPFNLSITMDGLSGMKIYSKFTIDTQYLPSNYPNTVEFLIKSVTHNISNNKWTTKLESFCVSKGKFFDNTPPTPPKNNSGGVSGGSNNENSGGNAGGGGVVSSAGATGVSAAAAAANGCPSDGEVYIKAINPPDLCVNKYLLASRTDKGSWKKAVPYLKEAKIQTYKKTQIYIHHTAGWAYSDKGKNTVNFWNRTAAKAQKGQYLINGKAASWCPSSPYVIDKDGFVCQLADDRYLYITQGNSIGKAETNEIGIGIEVCNPGPAKQDGSGNWIALGANITKNYKTYGFTSPPVLGNGISELVDWNGYPITWNTYKYGVSYPPSQIAGLEKLLLNLMSKHGIPFKWKGEETYKQMFPVKTNASLDAPRGVPGIYSHRAVTNGKSDCLPTKEIIAMLKRIGK